jgi:peptidoglycan/xylan/chitin deacetylase (PgdA/CDA1 family)
MFLLIIGALIVAIWFVVFWIQPLAILSIFERLTPNVIYRVRVELPLVALSFDDGPHPTFTPQVLDILQAHHAKATFFLIGERALLCPELVARIKAAGHEVGNHYYKDGSTFAHSDTEFLSYLQKTEKGTKAVPRTWRYRLAQTAETCPSTRLQIRFGFCVPE